MLLAESTFCSARENEGARAANHAHCTYTWSERLEQASRVGWKNGTGIIDWIIDYDIDRIYINVCCLNFNVIVLVDVPYIWYAPVSV